MCLYYLLLLLLLLSSSCSICRYKTWPHPHVWQHLAVVRNVYKLQYCSHWSSCKMNYFIIWRHWNCKGTPGPNRSIRHWTICATYKTIWRRQQARYVTIRHESIPKGIKPNWPLSFYILRYFYDAILGVQYTYVCMCVFVSLYFFRLKSYLTRSKATMSSQLGDTTAKCRPFFDIFDANRIFLCRNMIDFVNALWFCTFLTLLLWSIGTPVGLNLISLQRKLTNLKRAKLRAAERAADREESRGRGRDRDRGAATGSRDRSTSSAGRRKPAPL